MANEFIARKGLVSSGSVNVSGSVTASFFKGDGSQLTNLPIHLLVMGQPKITYYPKVMMYRLYLYHLLVFHRPIYKIIH
jgi:hypothetical protein